MEIPRKNWDIFSKETAFSPITSLMLLVLLIFFSSLVSFSILLTMSALVGENFNLIGEKLIESNDLELRNITRLSIFIQHFFLFILPGLAFSFILYRKEGFRFLRLSRLPSFINILLGSLFIITAFPLAQLSYQLNKKISLPIWAQSIEEKAADLIGSLLVVEAPYEFYLNLFIMAMIPAIGEEIIFRGILQQKLQKAFNHPIWAIALAAFIFSAFHMQFEGLIPRFFLGILLGLTFYWTKNLWVPIVAHFVFNAIQILAHKLYQAEVSRLDLDNMEAVPWSLSFISLILVFGIAYFMRNFNENQLKI